MNNIRIQMVNENYIVVIADSERFGRNEVMYEGNCFDECLDYCKRELNKDTLRITGRIAACVTDRKGRVFPAFMRIE